MVALSTDLAPPGHLGQHPTSSGAAAPAGTGARARRSQRTRELFAEISLASDPATVSRLRGDVVVANRPVAEAVAARYRGRGVPVDDLTQAASEGLVKAVLRFDPTRHHDFLTYAVPTMRGEVQRYFRDLGWTVRPPRRVQELQWRINRTVGELRHQLGREPAPAEVVEALGISTRELDEAQAAYGAFSPASLDRPVGSDATVTLGELLPDEDVGFAQVEDREALEGAMRSLSPRDRRVVYLRFWEERMQREIGQELGITQMQVSRVLTRVLERLRLEMTRVAPG